MMHVRMSISCGGRRTYLAVTYNHVSSTWNLQWARPTEYGHHYDPPIERGFKTKKAALARKRELT